MKNYYILLLILLTSCSIDKVDGSGGGNDTGETKPPEETPSVADYGLLPSLDVTVDAGAKLSSIIKSNPSIHTWFIPKGEYNFKTLKLSDFSGKILYGDTGGNTIFRFNKAEGYPKNIECPSVRNLTFYNIAWANVRLMLNGAAENIKFDSNIFYGLVYSGTANDKYKDDLNNDYLIQVGEWSGTQNSKNITIKNSVFFRSQSKFEAYKNSPFPDKANGVNYEDEGYFLRRQYGIRFLTVSNVIVSDNIFGMRTTEIEKAKSFAKTVELKSTITRASSLMNGKDQVYFTTAINTAPKVITPSSLAQDLRIINNLFNGWFSRNYATESLVQNNQSSMPRSGENRFYDHANYLRGVKKMLFAGNLVRGWDNDAAGGIKLKSGIDIAIVNNHFENTGLILVRSVELDKTFSNMLVMNNYFKINDVTGKAKLGITFDEDTMKGQSTNENHSSYNSQGITDMLTRIRYIVFSGNKMSQKTIQATWFDGTPNPSTNLTSLKLNDVSPRLYNQKGVVLPQAVHDSKIQVHDNTYNKPKGERLIENRTTQSFEYTETPFDSLHPEAMNLYKNERDKYSRPKAW